MSEVATIPESNMIDRRPEDQWPEPPRLLVEWSSPWEEFKSALRPALTRPPKRLAGEAPIGIFPYRGMLAGWLLECLLLIALIVLPEHFVSLEIPTPTTRPQQDVIYYSGNELPQTSDRGGAHSGKSGRAGGQQAQRKSCGRSQNKSAAFRFRGRQSARLQIESRTAARRRPAFFSHRTSAASNDDECRAAFAGIKFLFLPNQLKRSDDQRHPSRARSFSHSHAHLANPELVNRPSRPECFARQNADRQPARADRRCTGSTRRAARFGRFPCPADAKR